MKIAILGYGLQGQSAYKYWSRHDNQITVCDHNTDLDLPQDMDRQLGDDYLEGLKKYDLLIRSPAVHPRELTQHYGPEVLNKVTTVTNEFFKVCPSRNLIGVTGTKGKGTTSTLIAKMLEAGGQRVHLGGNIGTPPLDMLSDNIQLDDWVVLELANFQLIDLRQSPHIAVCLMVVPEHLDWHLDTEEYYAAKAQLFSHQKPDDIAIYYAANENSHRIATAGPGQAIPYFAPPGAYIENNEVKIDGQAICGTDELKLLGRHNWQNVCAAVTAVWQISQSTEAIRSVLISFSGLPFRIEPRGEKHGIRYYNDSFASQPSATMAAIEAVPGPQVLIVGGFDRKLELDELAESLKQAAEKIRKVLVIGDSGQRIRQTFDNHGFTSYEVTEAKDMPTVVKQATDLARPGDAVVLSPGFASFDMFKNFEDRGRQFNQAVEAL